MSPHPGDAWEIAAIEQTLYRAMIERDLETLRSLRAKEMTA